MRGSKGKKEEGRAAATDIFVQISPIPRFTETQSPSGIDSVRNQSVEHLFCPCNRSEPTLFPALRIDYDFLFRSSSV